MIDGNTYEGDAIKQDKNSLTIEVDGGRVVKVNKKYIISLEK